MSPVYLLFHSFFIYISVVLTEKPSTNMNKIKLNETTIIGLCLNSAFKAKNIPPGELQRLLDIIIQKNQDIL